MTQLFIMTAVMLLTIVIPFAVYYAIKLAKDNKNFKKHRRIQNLVIIIGLLGLFSLEGLIRVSGGSGSLVADSSHYGTKTFKIILASHISGAVITYVLWIILVIVSNARYRKKLPGTFSRAHRRVGYVVFVGLIYTAVTALAVYLMSLNII